MDPGERLPVAAIARMCAGFFVTVAALWFVPRDPFRGVKSIGAPTPAVISVGFPTKFLTVDENQQPRVIARQPNEERVFFVGASETYALPYVPPGYASYGFHLGAGYQAATGRTDIHVRAEGNPALDSPQIVVQAKKILDWGDPSLIVFVAGANEFLNRIVHDHFLLPETAREHVYWFCGGARKVFERIEDAMRASDALRGLLGSGMGRAASFTALTRQGRPGRPALRSGPIGSRDRALLMERLADSIRDLHAACAEKGCRLAVALSLHGMDGAPPWCSVLEPGPAEIEELLVRVRDAPDRAQLREIERWLERYPERADLVHARAKLWRAGGNPKARTEFLRALDLDLVPLHQTGEVRETLRAVTGELGIPLLDLSEAFADGEGVTGPGHFLDYAHVDLAGHRKIALHLAKKYQGTLLPALPAGFEPAFTAAMELWSKPVTPSREKAQAEMSYTLGQYYMLFGNFREALPHCERAARVLGTEGPKADLEFCRSKLKT